MHATQINAKIFFNKVYTHFTAFSSHMQEFTYLCSLFPVYYNTSFPLPYDRFWTCTHVLKEVLLSSPGQDCVAQPIGYHRIIEWWGWKGPLWVTQSNPLPKQGHPEQAAQDLVQAGLEYLQRRRLHSLPGQPVPGLRHPQSEEVLPRGQLELPLLQFVPVAPCPVTGHH